MSDDKRNPFKMDTETLKRKFNEMIEKRSELLQIISDEAKELGSGLIDQIQKMTTAAMQMAEKKVWAHLS